VSTIPQQSRADTIAGFLCAFSLALSGVAMVRNPGLLAISVAVAAVAFLVGMVVSIWTDSPIF
jgi:hypothetical protein